jgi:hypothetical protein
MSKEVQKKCHANRRKNTCKKKEICISGGRKLVKKKKFVFPEKKT